MSHPHAQPPAADVNGQLIVALAIVGVLCAIAGGLIYAGVVTQKWDVLAGPIGTVIGGLVTALNAPSGIGNVLRANAANPPTAAPATPEIPK